jgi:hypothetical protein
MLPAVRKAMVNKPQYRVAYPIPTEDELRAIGINPTRLRENEIHHRLLTLRRQLKEADREDAALLALLEHYLMHWENLQDREVPTPYLQDQIAHAEFSESYQKSVSEFHL